jgi:hypothetical protein
MAEQAEEERKEEGGLLHWLREHWLGAEAGHAATEVLGSAPEAAHEGSDLASLVTKVPGLAKAAPVLDTVGKFAGPVLAPFSLAFGLREAAEGLANPDALKGAPSVMKGVASAISGIGGFATLAGGASGVAALGTAGSMLGVGGAGFGLGYATGTALDKLSERLITGEREIPGMPGAKNVLESERGLSGLLARGIGGIASLVTGHGAAARKKEIEEYQKHADFMNRQKTIEQLMRVASGGATEDARARAREILATRYGVGGTS